MSAKLCDLQMNTGQATKVEECVCFPLCFLSGFSWYYGYVFISWWNYALPQSLSVVLHFYGAFI